MRELDRGEPDAATVQRICTEVGFEISTQAAAQLAGYLKELQSWNRRMNLVGPKLWRDMLSNLVLDSLHLADFLDASGLPPAPLCLDLGAGAGIPGIPLRLVWQRGRYVMVEVRQKRAAFLRHVLSRLDLAGTEVFNGTVEDLSPQYRPADLVLSRAFRPWREMLDMAQGLLKPEGVLVIMSNAPPPDRNDLPCSWRLKAERSYRIMAQVRYFWSLSP